MSRLATCPDWCTTVHAPGSDPRRQSHSHKFFPQSPRSTEARSRTGQPAWISTYPWTQWDGGEPGVFLRVKAYGNDADIILALSDLRALVVDLSRMADMLEAEQALVNHQRVFQ